ncbi:MAG: aromatic ring-hydroxylating oxygenase subunit alpha [Ilumatobacteraceae bacterium]
MVAVRPHDFPADLLGAPLDRARTLPGRWYADPAHHALELDAIFRHHWVGAGCADDVAAPGAYLATHVGDVPVLVTRDDAGELRAFLNVCRHRGSPLAAGCGQARALSCPYHAWLYRLDGSLARAGGVGQPVNFDVDDFGLRPVQVTTFARSLLVNVDLDAAPFDPGPLAAGLTPYALDELELGRRSRYERRFNWKVLLENYCENYHTPFLHAQLPTAGYEYPIEVAGPAVFAWDRPLDPHGPAQQALHDHRPGDDGWSAVAATAADEPFNDGTYLAVFPNTAISCFAGFAATFRLVPTGPSTTVVEREYYWHPDVPAERRDADVAATELVVEQDLAMCEALQRTYDAGLSADGVLSTAHEAGVAHVHQLVLAALGHRSGDTA